MNCDDVAKLRTPLDAVCQKTDIGCVPIVSGKPTGNPQPDELPIAFDQSSTTLWLFSCKTHEWVPFQKFKLDQLSKINIDNVRNICDVLNIAVWYDSGSANVQGTVTLAELGEEILKCIRLKTNAVVVNTDTAKFTVQGLDNLPPFYVRGENIWFTGGSGTETDPFKFKTYDPICKWPKRTQAQVDAATDKNLGACIDGDMVRIPYPDPPCSYPSLSQEQVDASIDKEIVACVNGEGVKIPYIESDPPLCELPLYTTSQVSDAGDNATLAVCVSGKSGRMPVPSGMFVPEYICVPKVSAPPNSAPDFGTGPLRIGCDDELYVWLCEEKRWQMVTLGHNKLPQLDIDDVANPCDNLKFFAWYRAGSEDCNQNRYVTLCQLAEILQDTDIFNNVVGQIARDAANLCKLPTNTAAQITSAGENASVAMCVNNTSVKTSVSNFGTALSDNSTFANNITNKVTNSDGFADKVNQIVKSDVNANKNNLTTTIIDKVVGSNRLQNPICSLASTTRSNMETNWNNITVPICENGTSKKIGINDFYKVITDKYVPPDTSTCKFPFGNLTFTVIVNGSTEQHPDIGRGTAFKNIVFTQDTLFNSAVYQSSTNTFIDGQGECYYERNLNDPSVGESKLTVVNNDVCTRYIEIDTNVFLSRSDRTDIDLSISGVCVVSDKSKSTWNEAITLNGTYGHFPPEVAVAAQHVQDRVTYGGRWLMQQNSLITGKAAKNKIYTLAGGQSLTLYCQLFVVFGSKTLTALDYTGTFLLQGYVNVKSYRGIYA